MSANATTTAPRKRGRPRKPHPLEAKVAELEAQLAAAGPVPTANPQELQPGEYFELLHGEVRKKRWTRADIERKYPAVTFTPAESMKVSPNGISWELVANEVAVTVPSIVKTEYDAARQARKDHAQMFRPWTDAEKSAMASAAQENPGHRIWSRTARLGQLGFDGLGPDADPSSAA